ncbi:MAG: TonB-dependent receptor [Alteromonadaceae bacterium]|nr:MAG: TonB-dependent receptor [Alteromonadaceae bacterium]
MNKTRLSLAVRTAISAAISAAISTTPAYSQDLAFNKLEEIIITASRTETSLRQVGASVSVLTHEDIELRGYPNIADLLRSQPGISASNSGGAGKATSVRIRGEEGFRTLIMIDGIDITDPTGTQAMPQVQHLLSTGDIERIEILRGPQGFIYGADAGGVVNIFTRSAGNGTSGKLSAEYGRFDSQHLDGHIAHGSERGDIYLSISDYQTDGFNARTDDASEDLDGYDNTTLHGKFGFNFNKLLRAQLVVRDVDAQSLFDNCFDPVDFSSRNDCSSDFSQTIARATLTYKDENNSHEFAVAHSEVERESFTGQDSSFATEGFIDKISFLASRTLSPTFKFVFGGDHETENVNVVDGDDLERDQSGVFAELLSNFSDKFYITAGARLDDNDDFGKHTSLRLSSAYVHAMQHQADLKFRASVGNGFRAPSLSELAYNASPFAFGEAASTVLQEESSQGYDLGIDYVYYGAGAFQNSSIELTYFNQDIEDEIFFDLAGFSGYLQSLGEIESKGFELAFDVPMGEHFKLLGNATYNTSTNSFNEQRVRRPKKTANLGFHIQLLSSKLNILTNMRFSRDSLEIDGLALDDYEILDISADYDVNDTLTLFIRAENITNEDYEEIRNFNTANNALYTGLRYTF